MYRRCLKGKTFPMQANIFSLDDPRQYNCMVESFVIGHAEMYIRVSHRTDNKYFRVWFVMVEYFSGPIRWESANFCLATSQDCLALLRDHIPRLDSLNDDFLTDNFKLYKVPLPKQDIEIIAAAAGISDEQKWQSW